MAEGRIYREKTEVPAPNLLPSYFPPTLLYTGLSIGFIWDSFYFILWEGGALLFALLVVSLHLPPPPPPPSPSPPPPRTLSASKAP